MSKAFAGLAPHRSISPWSAVAAALMAAATVGLGACEPAAGPEAAAPAGPPLTLGVLPATSAEDVRADYAPLAKRLSEVLERPVEIFIAKDYDALVDALAQGKLHLAQLSAYLYVRAKPSLQGTALAQQRMAWDTEYRGAFVVKKDSPIAALKDLQGKKVAYVDQHSSAGYFYPRMRLRELSFDPDTFFGGSVFAGSHKAAVDQVLAGTVDAAAISEQTLSEALSVKVLERTAVIPDDVIVAVGLDTPVVEKARAFFLKAHEDPAMNAFMNQRGIETYVRPNVEVYEPLEKEMGLSTSVKAAAAPARP